MTFFDLMAAISGIAAGLCVLALLPWIFGIPGNQVSDFARGWRLGLLVLISYPPLSLVLYVTHLVVRSLVDGADQARWQSVVAGVATLLLLLAAGGLWQAFRAMRPVREDVLAANRRYYERMLEAEKRLSVAEKADLYRWKWAGTLDPTGWPGWQKHIGPPPRKR